MPTLQWSDDECARRAEDGSIWVSIDDNEAHYLKVIMDEVSGVLGDRRTAGVNVLNSAVYAGLPPFDGLKVIYGEWCQWGSERLKREKVAFRQTPYDIRVR